MNTSNIIFTDKYLQSLIKRLNEHLFDELDEFYPFKYRYLTALVARLHASEEYQDILERHIKFGRMEKEVKFAKRVYLKAAGKDSR